MWFPLLTLPNKLCYTSYYEIIPVHLVDRLVRRFNSWFFRPPHGPKTPRSHLATLDWHLWRHGPWRCPMWSRPCSFSGRPPVSLHDILSFRSTKDSPKNISSITNEQSQKKAHPPHFAPRSLKKRIHHKSPLFRCRLKRSAKPQNHERLFLVDPQRDERNASMSSIFDSKSLSLCSVDSGSVWPCKLRNSFNEVILLPRGDPAL